MRQRALPPRQPSRHPAVVLFAAAATLGARARAGEGPLPLPCPTWEALGEGNAEFGAAKVQITGAGSRTVFLVRALFEAFEEAIFSTITGDHSSSWSIRVSPAVLYPK